MKKFTLIASMAAVAVSASAQYNVDPSLDVVLKAGTVESVEYIALDETSLGKLEAQGATCVNFGPNGTDQNLYVWDGTMDAGDASYPGVDMQLDGYASLVVGNVGWSGAGYNIAKTGAGVSTMMWNDNTHFHLAYYSPATVCPSIGIILGDQDGMNTPAKISLGNPFVDGGVTFPSLGAVSKDDWQGIDITFGELKKIFPAFNYRNTNAWTGNIMSFLAGGVTGQSVAFDAVYFYNYKSNGIEDISIDNATAPVEYYNLQGVRVENPTEGLYIRRQGSSVAKILVK